MITQGGPGAWRHILEPNERMAVVTTWDEGGWSANKLATRFGVSVRQIQLLLDAAGRVWRVRPCLAGPRKGRPK